MARAVSTVLDVAVCLLFVGAAIATLAGAPQPTDGSDTPDADVTASTVATVTTGIRAADDRRAHDTLAGHLATAAIADARADGDPVVETNYPRAVENETDALTGDRTFVTAGWEPYPGAHLDGRVTAGERPPPSADVVATTLTVDNGVSIPARTETFAGLAGALADTYVTWLFPPERTYASLVDDRTAEPTERRYRSVGETLGGDVDSAVDDREVRAVNDELASLLAGGLEADLRDRFPTPRAAASNVTVDEVDIVVRRWKP